MMRLDELPPETLVAVRLTGEEDSWYAATVVLVEDGDAEEVEDETQDD